MLRFLRVLKASSVIGAIWAVVWGVFGAGLSLISFGGDPYPFTTLQLFALITGSIAGTGFVGGSIFSLALATLQRRMSLDELSAAKVGVAGALGGAATLPALALAYELLVPGTGVVLSAGTIGAFSVFGTVSALITLKVARSGPELPAGKAPDMLTGS